MKKIYLSSPTMYGDELKYMKEAYDTNWMSTVGENINEIEKQMSERLEINHALALSSGTSALHLAVKLANVKKGDKVFVSDLTFFASVNPIIYEGAEPVFIDSEYDTWNMDPELLREAFKKYPEVKVVILVHLYGTPAKLDEIKEICIENNAILIEDAAESLGATYKGKETGTFGEYNVISFNGNKIITGSGGGMLLTENEEAFLLAKKYSTQSRENASWYQHKQVGYNYRMSNVIAGVIRGQIPYLEKHIEQKKSIYEKYKKDLEKLPIQMNPLNLKDSKPNYWLSCMLIDEEYMSKEVRSEENYLYEREKGKTSPMEILDALNLENIEGRPIWKPMHMQPLFQNCDYITKDNVGEDLFNRGLCFPSDNKMTFEDQDRVIKVIRKCFE